MAPGAKSSWSSWFRTFRSCLFQASDADGSSRRVRRHRNWRCYSALRRTPRLGFARDKAGCSFVGLVCWDLGRRGIRLSPWCAPDCDRLRVLLLEGWSMRGVALTRDGPPLVRAPNAFLGPKSRGSHLGPVTPVIGAFLRRSCSRSWLGVSFGRDIERLRAAASLLGQRSCARFFLVLGTFKA